MDRDDHEHFRTTASRLAEQSNGNSRPERSRSGLDLAYCQTIARGICGCYRRDEAQDPETFAAALAIVLQDYPADIVRLAGDPRTGVITAFPMGLPNVGQIREFLEDKLSHQEKLKRLGSLPKPEFNRLPPPPSGPGDLANVFVSADSKLYQVMVGKAQTGDSREYRFEERPRPGIWVALSWFDGAAQIAKTFKVPTDDDLRALYPKPTAEGQGEAA